MTNQFESVPKNNPYSTGTKQVEPIRKAFVVDTFLPNVSLPLSPAKDPIGEIERCLANFRELTFNQVAGIIEVHIYNQIRHKQSRGFINIYQYNSYVELSKRIIKNSNSIVSPAVNAMLLSIKAEGLKGVYLSKRIGISFFSAYENSKSYGELFLNETLNSVKYYMLGKIKSEQVINICKSYMDKYILAIPESLDSEIGIDDLLIGLFKKSDLEELLIHLEVIDKANKIAIIYLGKARGKVSGFTAAYRVLEQLGFAEKTLYPDKWASVFRDCYHTTLTAKTARYTMNGHYTQRSKSFESQFRKALEWVTEWKAKRANLL